MKLIYHKYYLEFGGSNYLADIRKIFSTYLNSPALRGTFQTSLGEPLYLFSTVVANLYLFAMIRDDEMVKAIDKKKLSQTDIKNKLSQDESLGFASYIYVGEHFFGIASTFFGPKNGIWQEFVTNLIQKLCKEKNQPMDVKFRSEPFPTAITRQEAQKEIDFFGTTAIKINDNSPMMAQLKALFGGSADVGSVEIIIRPPVRKFFNKTKDKILDTFKYDTGIDKFIVKGKRDASDSLTDLYIVGSGHITDNITGKSDNTIVAQIKKKADYNEPLTAAVKEFKNDKNFRHKQIPGMPGIF